MSKVLIATWAGGGNLPPALGLARALASAGHDVAFLGHAVQEAVVTGQGFAFAAYSRAVPWPPAVPPDPAGPPPSVFVFTDRGIGEDLVERLTREPADLVVIDHLLWGALEAAGRHRLRYATLFHTFFSQQHAVWSAGRGAEVAARFGFRPPTLWSAGRRVLITTLPELDRLPGDILPENAIQTGPVWQGRPRSAEPEAPPLVLVSLSTVPQDGQVEALQKIVDALSPLPLRALVTTGPAVDASQLRAPANTELIPFVPHETLMPRLSLVISHGGHSTAMAALSHDLPMLLMPMFELADQPVVARAIEARGAGLALARSSEVAEIRRAVGRLLHDPGFGRSAASLGAAIRRRDGADVAAEALAGLLTGDAAAAG